MQLFASFPPEIIAIWDDEWRFDRYLFILSHIWVIIKENNITKQKKGKNKAKQKKRKKNIYIIRNLMKLQMK